MTNDHLKKNGYLFNTILLLLYPLVSFVILTLGALYSNPNTEEFALCQEPRDLGWRERMIHMLVHFDGRYFTNFLHAFNPLTFDWINGYKLMPAIAISFFIFAGYFLVSHFVIGKSKPNVLLVIAVVAFLQFQLSASLPCQLYWMAGSFVYLWPWIFTFLWLGSYFRFIEGNSSLKLIMLFIFTLLFLFCALGLNEMFLAANAIMLGTVLTRACTLKKKFPETLLIVLFGIACMLLFVTSPGISVRAADYRVEGSPLINISNLLRGISDNIIITKSIFLSPFLILASLALFPVLKKIRVNGTLFFDGKMNSQKAMFIVLFLMIVSYVMTLAYYIPMQIDTGLPIRIYTATSLLLIVAALFFYSVILNLFDRYLKKKNFEAQYKLQIIFPVILILCTFCVSKGNSFRRILVDYKSGVMTNFDTAMRQRYAMLYSAKTLQTGCYKIAVLDAITQYPESIYYGPDLLPNRNYPFGNESWEAYFRVDEIMLRGDTIRKYKM